MPFFDIDHRVSSDLQYEHVRTWLSVPRPYGWRCAVGAAGACLRSSRHRSHGHDYSRLIMCWGEWDGDSARPPPCNCPVPVKPSSTTQPEVGPRRVPHNARWMTVRTGPWRLRDRAGDELIEYVDCVVRLRGRPEAVDLPRISIREREEGAARNLPLSEADETTRCRHRGKEGEFKPIGRDTLGTTRDWVGGPRCHSPELRPGIAGLKGAGNRDLPRLEAYAWAGLPQTRALSPIIHTCLEGPTLRSWSSIASGALEDSA